MRSTLTKKNRLKSIVRFLQEVNIPKHAPKIALSNKPLYADQVLVFVNDDLDVSEGEDSDFVGDGVYSYCSDAFGAISNIEELNSSPLPAIASGDEETLSLDSEWLPS